MKNWKFLENKKLKSFGNKLKILNKTYQNFE